MRTIHVKRSAKLKPAPKQARLTPVIDRLQPEVVASWLPEAIANAGGVDVAKGRVSRPARPD